MALRIVADPAEDPQWSSLLDRHPAASVFHSPGWLKALRQTYGYRPFVVTTSTGSTLDNGLVACLVNGWPSRRLVSLPFSDHCDPLINTPDDLAEMLPGLMREGQNCRSAVVELRPRAVGGATFDHAAGVSGFRPGNQYAFHRLDLRDEGADIFRRFHHSTQRAVRRAEREGLTYEAGTSEPMLAAFYRLLRMTRRRHALPPQPIGWFRNLLSNLGHASVHVASKNSEPIASVLTLSFKNTIYYKYGGSNAAHHRLGGMSFLMWRVIEDARRRGLQALDLGRSDLDQPGLIAFKDHLGAGRSTLSYHRYPGHRDAAHSGWLPRAARGMVAYLPDAALDLAGRLIYGRLG
jgi:CelD/BcsL family acetyltransferase involved in cellulose biosynthesis